MNKNKFNIYYICMYVMFISMIIFNEYDDYRINSQYTEMCNTEGC